jgi:hypothetical protein
VTVTSSQTGGFTSAPLLQHRGSRFVQFAMGIGFATIARFENEGLFSISFDPRKARETLEAAGVEFVDENDDGGAGVRLTKTPK